MNEREQIMLDALRWIRCWLFQAKARKQDWWNLETAMTEIQAAYEKAEEALGKVEIK